MLDKVAVTPRFLFLAWVFFCIWDCFFDVQVTECILPALLVHELRPFLGKKDLSTVSHVLVTSRHDYCNALYVGLRRTETAIGPECHGSNSDAQKLMTTFFTGVAQC